MSFDNYKYTTSEYKNAKKSIKLNQNSQPEDDSQEDSDKKQQEEQYHEEEEKQKPNKKISKNKKKVKKQEQNQGIRIAKEKKIQYLFRNICNPSGHITLESLGRALAKHKIQFKVSELQQMIAMCSTQQFNQEESNSFDSQINETIRDLTIKYEDFRQFYVQKF